VSIGREGSYLRRLDQATLARAFRGELLAQDSDDKPASALLKRVREGRAKKQQGS